MFAELFRVPEAGRRIAHLLEKVGLSGVRRKRMAEFSHGMMQKLSIIRALLPDPDILFLDEPISGLDPFGVKQTRDLILEENREGRTIFISSHILSEVEKICHRVAIIYRGRLLAEDQMGSLLSRPVQGPGDPRGPGRRARRTSPARVRGLAFVLQADAAGNTLVVKVPKSGDYRKELSAVPDRPRPGAPAPSRRSPSRWRRPS